MNYTENNIYQFIGKKWTYIETKNSVYYVLDKIENTKICWIRFNNKTNNKLNIGSMSLLSFIENLNKKVYNFTTTIDSYQIF